MQTRKTHKKPHRLSGWIAMLRQAMAATGHGYMRHSLRHTGIGDDRRADKLIAEERGASADARRYATRYNSPPPKHSRRPWSSKGRD